LEVVLIFLAVVATIVGWWLSRQRLFAKPWLEEGVLELPGTGASPLPPAKLGLGVFIVVASALFSLFLSAYAMRMQGGDWRALPTPRLLWLNTGILVLSSIALHWALVAAKRRQFDEVRTALAAGAAFAVAFLIGQVLAWAQLVAAGYGLAANPANAFFYVLTAAHGLHLLGGLVALGRSIDRVWRGVALAKLTLSVELCAIYWHFLLFVWLVLFGLLLLGPDTLTGFIARCIPLILGTNN
jgi:cytochrome c oxidase subunit 3